VKVTEDILFGLVGHTSTFRVFGNPGSDVYTITLIKICIQVYGVSWLETQSLISSMVAHK